MSERDYGSTGASQGGGSIFCTASAKEGVFKINKQPIGSVLSGYMDSFEIRRDEGNKEEKIAAGWVVRIVFSTRDDERGVDEGNGVKVAKYNMEFSMIAQSATSAFLNVVGATDMNWDGYLRMAWYKPDNFENHRLSVYTSKNHDSQNRPPLLRKFLNNDTHMYEGIPKGLVIGQDGSGNNILDYREPQNEWLKIAIDIAKKYGQTSFPIGPRAAGKFYNIDGYWGEGIATEAPTTTTPAPASSDFVTKFNTSVLNKVLAANNGDGLKAIVPLLEGHKPQSMSWDDVEANVNKALDAHPTLFKWRFNATLKTFYLGDPVIPEVENPEAFNDLPF